MRLAAARRSRSSARWSNLMVSRRIARRWPHFRGPNFDGISPRKRWCWPIPGWRRGRALWSVEVGEAMPVRWFSKAESICWTTIRTSRPTSSVPFAQRRQGNLALPLYPVKIKRFHGMSRTVPAVTDKYVVTLGPKGHVTCLDSKTGEFRWMLNLVKEYGTTIPQWYAAQCPLIDDGKAIIAPAGTVLMMAVDCETGKIVWQTPNPNKWVMTHCPSCRWSSRATGSTSMPADRPRRGGVVGVSAKDGQVLWKTDEWKVRTNVPMPLVVVQTGSS